MMGMRGLIGALAVSVTLVGCAGSYPRGTRPVTFDPRAYYQKRALAVLEGTASYYADSLAGRATASGEAYDPRYYSAAHRTLPLGTILRVTRVQTGDWVLVRVNDRGPFASAERILDLSKVAARRLDMLRAGVVRVRAEVLEWGPPKRKKRRR
jgi:rare lipoprotein A